jgi:hypothetical protein
MHSLGQFVTFFGSACVQSGEAGYWWAQFSTAVHFIQSIDDRVSAASAPESPDQPSQPAEATANTTLEQ